MVLCCKLIILTDPIVQFLKAKTTEKETYIHSFIMFLFVCQIYVNIQWNTFPYVQCKGDCESPFLLQSLGPSLTSTLKCLNKDEMFLLTWPAIFLRFHWTVLRVIQLAYSIDILDRHGRSVKSSTNCWDQVRKNHHSSVKSSKHF